MFGTVVDADFSGFAPSALTEFQLYNAGESKPVDLSGLKDCPYIEKMRLGLLRLNDLSFLNNAPRLSELWLEELDGLRDISALGGLKKLDELFIGRCNDIRDFSSIGGCEALTSFHADGMDALRDASFLRNCPDIKTVEIEHCRLKDLEFLDNQQRPVTWNIKLSISGCEDFSGLAYVRNFSYLFIDPSQEGEEKGDIQPVLEYLKDADIFELNLDNCRNLDLGMLPSSVKQLTIGNCNELTDLSGFAGTGIRYLNLYNMQRLNSLNGIEKLTSLVNAEWGRLEIWNCPRLTDWSALDGASLDIIKLGDIYALPDLSKFRFRTIYLDGLTDLEDLSIFDGKQDGWDYMEIYLHHMDQLQDINALSRFHGEYLEVPPQLTEQAQELVDSGAVKSFEVFYPEGGWEPMDYNVEIFSIDDLNTLPKALLKHVGYLNIVGDQVFDWEYQDVWDDWKDDRAYPVLYDRETDKTKSVKKGSFRSISELSDLTGLRDLNLMYQPLKDLNGIQVFSELERVDLEYCHDLTDVSALFSMQHIQEINLRQTDITSIQGIQNIKDLTSLNIENTKVSDISPLAGCDFSYAYEDGGFNLNLNDTQCEDLSPLSVIKEFDWLSIREYPYENWADAVAGADIRGIFFSPESDEVLERFISDHPEVEELHIQWKENITDLTPLLDLENLRHVKVSSNMKDAIASLDGKDYQFELEIEE